MIKKQLKKIIPPSWLKRYHLIKSKSGLRQITRLKDNVSVLQSVSEQALESIFKDQALEQAWNNKHALLKSIKLPELSGGINQGDQRALFYLIRHFQPKQVLEIGTHIGCSSLMIALALQARKRARFSSVDIIDVNDIEVKRWLNFGSSRSPLEMIKMLKMENQVQFIQSDAVAFLGSTDQKFDFIFLDGSHERFIIFKEMILALQLLNKNGLILLHDYFPDNQPIWNNNKCISGPFLAGEDMKKRSNNLKILPLGNLPWKTKLGSNKTSLALMTR